MQKRNQFEENNHIIHAKVQIKKNYALMSSFYSFAYNYNADSNNIWIFVVNLIIRQGNYFFSIKKMKSKFDWLFLKLISLYIIGRK